MIALVTGGSASGKSELAERLAKHLGSGRRLYIATMRPYDEESKARVARHHKLRAGKGFETSEQYGLIQTVQPNYSVILLECLSNLLANCMFGPRQHSLDEVKRGLFAICGQSPHTVIVTNEVFTSGELYSNEMTGYIAALGELNRELASKADLVVESVCGLADVRKGELPWLCAKG